jgi:hypothetical protein
MARPRVADGEDGLQIWSTAANILNKQSRAADIGWYSRLGLGEVLTSPNNKNQPVTKCFAGPQPYIRMDLL